MFGILLSMFFVSLLQSISLRSQLNKEYKPDPSFAAKGQLDTLGAALWFYKTPNEDWPTSEQGLNALVEPPAEAKMRKPLLKASAILDPWNKPFGYRRTKEPELDGYDVWSAGPDQKDYSEDDIIKRQRMQKETSAKLNEK